MPRDTPFRKTFAAVKPMTPATVAPIFPVALTLLILTSCHLTVEKPVTAKEADDFAKKIEKSVEKQNPVLLNDIVDAQQFGIRILQKAGQRFNLVLDKSAQTALASLKLGDVVMQAIHNGGTYQLLRRYEKEGHQHLIFRLLAEGGLNYHDYELVNTKTGVKAIDMYTYASGAFISDAVTDELTQNNDTRDLTGDEKESADLLKSMRQYLKGGNPDEANDYYNQASDKEKKQRPVQKLHLRIAEKQGDSSLRVAQQEYKTDFPDDAFIYLSIFMSSAAHQDYTQALSALNRFDQYMHDPFLDYCRGMLYKTLNDPAASSIALERLHTLWPTFGPAIVQLIDNHVKGGHPDSAALLVKEAENLKNITPDQLESVKKAYPALKP
jgi:tetratricopeptide (TPR) repeat protein